MLGGVWKYVYLMGMEDYTPFHQSWMELKLEANNLSFTQVVWELVASKVKKKIK